MANPEVRQRVLAQYQPYVAHWRQRKVEMRSRLQAHHQAGLQQAKELADLLKTDFGATKVVLFGSMLSLNNVHMGSDIDLAVWGLPYSDYFAALSKLLNCAKAFDVDLVRIEEAAPSLKAHILSEGLALGTSVPQSNTLTKGNLPMPTYQVLIARIQRELQDIHAQYQQTQDQLEVARETGQTAYWMAVSLGMHGIYTGLEKVFEQIAREVDGELNQRSDRWHRELLEQMAADIPTVRAAVIDHQTFINLAKYLSFRHVVRSNYAYRLEPERIDANFQLLENDYASLVRQLNAFCDFLSSVDSTDSTPL
jgi:predicted nucleotidyltransferase